MIIPRLAIRSLFNRRVTALLTVVSIAVSVLLLLGVEQVRTSARASFANTISGTDLIVGARSGPVQLLLFSVFRVGNATNNITWETYQDLAAQPDIDWLVPLSLGDSHRGFRVLGTTTGYFEHFRYGRDHPLAFAAGGPFADLFDAVLGAEVAAELGYGVGESLIVTHGIADSRYADHDDKPFRVAGILAHTGTPVDRSVHVSLEAIEAIHVDWTGGARVPGRSIAADQVRQMDLTPSQVTAVLVGLKSPLGAFRVQRFVNEYPEEPLLAILPGVALAELWGMVGIAETALLAVSIMVVATALLGMITVTLSTLNERRREMAILRSVGARPLTVLGLLVAEAAVLAVLGAAGGVVLLYLVLAIAQPLVERGVGLYLEIGWPGLREGVMILAVLAAGAVAGLLPALRAYRNSVADGMTVRT